MDNNKIMSDSIDQLATALAKAQSEMKAAIKNQNNPYFKSMYADFESIKEATVPALSKYGLSVTQPVVNSDDGSSYITTILLHSSGQWVRSTAKISPAKSDIQSLSSYNTYLKRMCYSNIVGVATSENDDDGESTMSRNQQQPYSPESAIITGYQHTILMNLIVQAEPGKEKAICDHYGINDLTKLPASKYNEVKYRLELKK